MSIVAVAVAEGNERTSVSVIAWGMVLFERIVPNFAVFEGKEAHGAESMVADDD
jgi:hypothetical protein